MFVTGLIFASCHEKEYEVTTTVNEKAKEFETGFKNAFTSNINPNQTWGFNVGSQVASSRALSRGEDTKATTRGEINYEPTGGIVVEERTDLEEKTTTTFTEFFKKRTLVQYGRVFCEDLGGNYASNRKDFDYNDVVFDAYLWKEELWKKITVINTYEVKAYQIETHTEYEVQYNEKGDTIFIEVDGKKTPKTEPYEVNDTLYNKDLSSKRNYLAKEVEYAKVSDDSTKFYADICLLACGATKPVKVGGNDATEVHQAFGGYGVDIVINAFDKHSEREGGFGSHEVAEPVTFERVDITQSVRDNGNFFNPTINDIPIFVQWDETAATNITAKRGEVPQKFMMSSKAKWTSERCFLGNAYPQFTDWVESAEALLRTDQQGDDNLYSNYPGPSAGLDFNVSTGESTTTCLEVLKERTDSITEANTSLVIHELYDSNGEYVETLSGEPAPVEQQHQSGNQGGGNNNQGGGGNNNQGGGNSGSGSSNTSLWSGSHKYDGWGGPDTYNLSNGSYAAGNVLRIYLTYNPYYNKTSYTFQVNHINWGGTLINTSVPSTSTYVDYTLSSNDAEKLAANKAIWIAAECCIVTKIELRK